MIADMLLNLLIIDGQGDFCSPLGKLFVKGADKGAKNVKNLINKLQQKWFRVFATFDSHDLVHCAHPVFWHDDDGKRPSPGTILTLEYDGIHPRIVAESKTLTPGREYHPTDSDCYNRMATYLRKVGSLTIHPPHCLIGTPGWCMDPDIMESLLNWEAGYHRVEKIVKGKNAYTEQYSAISARLPDDNDPSTQVNHSLIKALFSADYLVIVGWAMSHCVGETIKDLIKYVQNSADINRIILLTDCTSSVEGCEHWGDKYIKNFSADRKESGLPHIRVSTSTELIEMLAA
jgi:nicotinamidase/pyrazinamidase